MHIVVALVYPFMSTNGQKIHRVRCTVLGCLVQPLADRVLLDGMENEKLEQRVQLFILRHQKL